jgi:hypothetical protein
MERLIINNSDVRNYRQLGKQVNADNFSAIAKEVQDNELTELLGRALAYDFFNFLDNDWIAQAGTFTRNSDTQFTAAGIDLSAWTSDYSLRINDTEFVSIVTSVFGGTDTTITVKGYVLPTLITTLEYKITNDYIKLLNGTSYTNESKTIQYNGLRPFAAWKFLAIYLLTANVKHSDIGNFSIASPNFERPSNAAINATKSTYLQNSVRSENEIIDYLNENSSIFTLWESKKEQNLEDYSFIVI